jgi:hypothetical protein
LAEYGDVEERFRSDPQMFDLVQGDARPGSSLARRSSVLDAILLEQTIDRRAEDCPPPTTAR